MSGARRRLRNFLSVACLFFTLVFDVGHFLFLCLRPSPALEAKILLLRKRLVLYQERHVTAVGQAKGSGNGPGAS
jgi:hypothetical protein